MEIEKIATIHTDFPDKFGVPRQSRVAASLQGRIVMEKDYSGVDFFRGIENWSHLWVIWGFSRNEGQWKATARPPRLGGNRRVGVFACRTPFRPNNLGLSLVKLEKVLHEESEMVLCVSGIDMVDGTPVYDIKPYLPQLDFAEEAVSSMIEDNEWTELKVNADLSLLERIPEEKREGLLQVLSQDPRPQYHDDPDRVYGFIFAEKEIKFKVEENTLILVDITDRISEREQ